MINDDEISESERKEKEKEDVCKRNILLKLSKIKSLWKLPSLSSGLATLVSDIVHCINIDIEGISNFLDIFTV